MKILAHTSFIGTSGYANHARSFFTALNKYHTVKVRNFTVGNSWNGYNLKPHEGETYLTDEMKNMLHQQILFNEDQSRSDFPIYSYDEKYKPDVHIVLVETNHHMFYDEYDGYKIAYNVWESTRYPDDFFKQLLKFDEMWVPTQWQYDCIIEQGYPKEKVFIVPEGVDVDTFKPIEKYPKRDKIQFVYFGRWDYRKGTTEVLRAFSEEFKDVVDIELIASVENPYPYDGLKSTEERVKHHNIDTKNIKFVKFFFL
jgi:glycosyltransferase involved in cell wall biosynthesis